MYSREILLILCILVKFIRFGWIFILYIFGVFIKICFEEWEDDVFIYCGILLILIEIGFFEIMKGIENGEEY